MNRFKKWHAISRRNKSCKRVSTIPPDGLKLQTAPVSTPELFIGTSADVWLALQCCGVTDKDVPSEFIL
jgi:hypothetical protein